MCYAPCDVGPGGRALRRDELGERSQAALDLLGMEVDRFRQLVEDLLEMSRYDAGAVRLELDDIRLAEFVMQAVKVSTNGDSVPVDLDSELAGVVVQADKRRLARVVANLLDNARKYGDGATSVVLRAACVDAGQSACGAVPGGPKGLLAALNKNTGAVVWQSKDVTDSATYSSPVLATVGGMKHYVQMVQNGVVGILTLKPESRAWKVAVLAAPSMS